MRIVALLLYIAIGCSTVFADDNSCLNGARQLALSGAYSWSENVQKLVNFTEPNLRNLPHEKEDFTQVYSSSRGEITSLKYSYTVKAGLYEIRKETTLEKTAAVAESKFNFEQETTVLGHDLIPIVHTFFKYAVDANCQFKQVDFAVISYSINSADPSLVDVKLDLPKDLRPEDKREFTISKESLINGYKLSDVNWDKNHPEVLPGASPVSFLAALQNGRLDTEIEIQKMPPRRMFNPRIGRIELMERAYSGDAKFLKKQSHTGFEIFYGSHEYQTSIFKYESGNTQTHESLLKEDWLKVSFSQQKRSTAIGTKNFTDADMEATELTYEVDLTEFHEVYENHAQYFKTINTTRSGGNFKLTVQSIKPSHVPLSLPWVDQSNPGGPDLDSTVLVNLDDVKEIADKMRPSLKGKTRLEVSRAIIRKVNELIQYDSETVSDGYNEERTAKETLQKGRGICQHFSGLFQGIARSLGIPARVVGGYRVFPTFAGGHAWVEVKINDTDWWPLDPQIDSDFLPSRGYFPMVLYGIYSAHDAKEFDQQVDLINHELKAYSFKKISSVPAPSLLGHFQ